ncbi:nuclear transport factor 2 family protein [Agromyces sp. LHK192]|uniref:nuclear transport factor 2 family protein n=1 Tax=Agromyces sp. LHK192 TaxID=2498704 RepID=UPI000FDC246F|nr:nuclear transport factor 2 family protein [Agromyces sp. LHK192]
MDAETTLKRLVETIDAHDWARLGDLLHERFTCTLVHTGERFGRDAWIRLNAEYPGFEHMFLEDAVAVGDRAVGRARVTGRSGDEVQEFQVASFLTVADEQIIELVEVWTDVGQSAPDGTRPGD